MKFEYFSHNGKLLPVSQAQVPLSLVEYSYGFGVYENIRYSRGVLYFLEDHVARLVESARIIGLEHEFAAGFVEDCVRALVKSVGGEACNLKILLIGGAAATDAQLFILPLNPLFPDRKLYQSGAAAITCEYERVFPHAKTLNMLQSYLAYREAVRAGAYDALLIDQDGNITEGTRTNFFCMRDRTIFSPPEDKILLGVTRKAMLVAAQADGFEVAEANIGRGDLKGYDCAFITSTSSKIIPIRSVDDEVLNERPPEVLERLMQVFNDFLVKSDGVLS